MKEILSIQGLRSGYGNVLVLKGISLAIHSGVMAALIGANGAGKTTTLRAITGLLKPFGGSITFHGHRIDGLAPHKIVALGISMVPENRRIFSNITVLDNLKAGAISCWDRSRITRDVEKIYGLFPILQTRQKQTGGTLSGGEQQMLAIGRALMSNPKLLLLDEPSMGLSPIAARVVFETIGKIASGDTPVLLVEQNATMALKLSQVGYVLETGKIALEGTSKDLFQNPFVKKVYLGEELLE